MVIYTVPAYIPTFQQAYPYGYSQQLIYPRTAVVTTPPTVIAAPPGGGVVIRPPGYTAAPVVVQQVPTVQVVAYQSGSGVSSVAQVVGAAAAGVVRSTTEGVIQALDEHAKSPLLDCFLLGSAVQLRSKKGGKMLCIDREKNLNCNGELGNDYNAHFLVVAKANNKIVLRNGEHADCHLATMDGLPCKSANGMYFRIHETPDHYVTLQNDLTSDFIGVDEQNHLLPTQFVKAYSDEAKFEVNLVYSPYRHAYEPVH